MEMIRAFVTACVSIPTAIYFTYSIYGLIFSRIKERRQQARGFGVYVLLAFVFAVTLVPLEIFFVYANIHFALYGTPVGK